MDFGAKSSFNVHGPSSGINLRTLELISLLSISQIFATFSEMFKKIPRSTFGSFRNSGFDIKVYTWFSRVFRVNVIKRKHVDYREHVSRPFVRINVYTNFVVQLHNLIRLVD